MKNYLTAEAAKELAKSYKPPEIKKTEPATSLNHWGRRIFRSFIREIKGTAKAGGFSITRALETFENFNYEQWILVVDKFRKLGYYVSADNRDLRKFSYTNVTISWREPTA